MITIGFLCLLVIAGIFAFLYFNKEKVGKIDAFPNEEVVFDSETREYDIGKLHVKDFVLVLDSSEGYTNNYIIEGTIENKNDFKLYNIKVQVTYYNINDEVIDKYDFIIKSIGANKSYTLNQKYSSDKELVYKTRITKIEGYRR